MPATPHIRNKLSQLPHRPGVYLMKDRFGTVIYIGKARDLRHRVSQYFHPSRRRRWEPRLVSLIEAIEDFDVHTVRSDADALLLEGRLIKEFKPRFNVIFRDDKRFLLLKVNLNDPIPRFTLTRIQQDDQCRYFGPFVSSGAIRRTLESLRKKFSLRGCRPLTPTEQDYRHCLYGHIKCCTAPCIGNVSREEYLGQVEAACEFLEGRSGEMESELKEEMERAAGRLDFEKAAQLRDMIEDLRQSTRKRGRYQRLPQKLPLAIDPDEDLAALARALELPAPPARIEGFDISTISGTFSVAAMVLFRGGRPDRTGYRRFRMKSAAGQDDYACMAETIRRRYSRSRRESPSQLPGLILVDGGKGQLGAAGRELARLGLEAIPAIGLAKEFEEIHRTGEREPLRLPAGSPALKLLQRIRDESHRFANTYNARLRLRKISESLLDEFPGMGPVRKAALLRHFGSVQRIRTAQPEAIAQVPGFGEATAGRLREFLAARTPRPDPGPASARGPRGPA